MATAPGAVPAEAANAALPELDVVIVAYRSEALLRNCLRSLERHAPTRARLAIHVVDNFSDDGTAEMVRRDFPGVHLEALSANRGFSYANNIVLRASRAPFVLLLNPDTEVTEGAIDRCLTRLEEGGTGMVGPRLVLPDGTFDHAAKRSFPTPAAALAHFAGVGRRRNAPPSLAGYRAPDVPEDGVGEVDAVNGAFMLVRRQALVDVGLLDEGYWLYMEDLDWCRRFHERGWRVIYDGTATVIHVKGASSPGSRRLRQNWAFHRGMGRFYRRYEAGRRPELDLAVYTGIVVKFALSAAVGSLRRVVRAITAARG